MDAYPCKPISRSAVADVLQSDALVKAIARELKIYYPDQHLSPAAIREMVKTLLSATPVADDQPRKPITSYFASVADVEETLYDILRYDMVYSAFGG